MAFSQRFRSCTGTSVIWKVRRTLYHSALLAVVSVSALSDIQELPNDELGERDSALKSIEERAALEETIGEKVSALASAIALARKAEDGVSSSICEVRQVKVPRRVVAMEIRQGTSPISMEINFSI